MVFKFLFLSVTCLAFFTYPAHCTIISGLSDITSAAGNVLSDIVSATGDVIKAKASSLVQAATQTGNILAVGAGLKAEALQKLTYGSTNAVANGLVSYGRLLSRLGTDIAEEKLDASPYAGLGTMVPSRRIFRSSRCGSNFRSGCNYEIVYTPRVYRGPRGSIYIE